MKIAFLRLQDIFRLLQEDKTDACWHRMLGFAGGCHQSRLLATDFVPFSETALVIDSDSIS
jgi:hypothetical protein